jgi:hypothetical protein
MHPHFLPHALRHSRTTKERTKERTQICKTPNPSTQDCHLCLSSSRSPYQHEPSVRFRCALPTTRRSVGEGRGGGAAAEQCRAGQGRAGQAGWRLLVLVMRSLAMANPNSRRGGGWVGGRGCQWPTDLLLTTDRTVVGGVTRPVISVFSNLRSRGTRTLRLTFASRARKIFAGWRSVRDEPRAANCRSEFVAVPSWPTRTVKIRSIC